MLAGLKGESDSCRLCFSEADELPGLIVDKYGDLIVLQLLTKGLDSARVRETCVDVLGEAIAPKIIGTGSLAAILERPDPRIRELEGLSAPSTDPLWLANPAVKKTSTEFHLNGLT